MSSRRLAARIACGVLLAAAVLVGPAAVRADQPTWVVTLNKVTAFSGPTADAVAFGEMPAMITLQVLGYDGDRARVLDPRSRTVSYVPSDQLAPGDPPSRYVFMPPPAITDEFDARGVVTDQAPLAVYPTPADEAAERELNPNTWLTLTGVVDG